MCSSRCEMPVMPVYSFREPTRYQTPKLTTGALRTSFVRMRSPLGRRVSITPVVSARSAGGSAGWPATSLTAASPRRRPRRSKPVPRGAGDREPFIDRTSRFLSLILCSSSHGVDDPDGAPAGSPERDPGPFPEAHERSGRQRVEGADERDVLASDRAVATVRVHEPPVRRVSQESDGVAGLVDGRALALRPAVDRLDDLDVGRG